MYPVMKRIILIMLLAFSGYSSAQSFSSTPKLLSADEFLPQQEAFIAQPSLSDNQLTIDWTIAPNHYLYGYQFKVNWFDKGLSKPLSFTMSKSVVKYDEFFDRELELFYETAQLFAALPKHNVNDVLELSYQGCVTNKLCYPPTKLFFKLNGDGSFSKTFEPSAVTTPMKAPALPFTELLFIILSAFLGGVILNVMPCVFPVLALKALSFSAHPEHRARNGLAYTLGCVLSFVGFAVIITALKAAGDAVGWGFQLQNPAVISGLALLFAAMVAVLAFDVPIGQKFMGLGTDIQQGDSTKASFFTGVLAVVVASPCTAPFMGVAIGTALTQSSTITFIIFAALGLGMAAPLWILSNWPALIRKIPKPGAWMNVIRQVMAFPLALTVAYLLWVFGQQTGVNGLISLLVASILMVFAIWLSLFKNWTARVITIAALVGTIYFAIPHATVDSTNNSDWLEYSPETLEQARTEGPVFVDVTAAWCITCLSNKRVLESDNMKQWFKEHNITKIEADWTLPDPTITKYLASFNRAGVPLYVYYPKQGTPVVLPQILTESELTATLNH